MVKIAPIAIIDAVKSFVKTLYNCLKLQFDIIAAKKIDFVLLAWFFFLLAWLDKYNIW